MLEGPQNTCTQLKLKHGSKIMLMSSAGGVQTGGQRAAQAVVAKRAQDAKLKLAVGLSAPGQPSSRPAGTSSDTLKARASGWSATGVVSLRGEGLSTVPEEAWGIGMQARVVDLGDNQIAEVGEGLARLPGLQRLRLAGNQLDSAIGLRPAAWQAMANMVQLVHLDLSRNRLETLPPEIGQLKVRSRKA